MNSINYRKYATKSAVNYNVLLRIAAIVMAMHIGSTSLRAGCHLDPTATTPPGGVKLQMIAFGDSLLDVGTYQQFAKANFDGGQFTTNLRWPAPTCFSGRFWQASRAIRWLRLCPGWISCFDAAGYKSCGQRNSQC